ncbi:hypothetical protein LGL55_18770 [Clostridium tagluense]|uniref:hypothetical protein n=1 Tax=Clostridium TaxID=1485 RepID=UPI0013E92FBF|nr:MULTISPECIES: hypothetical protein [Clostridium]MBU3129987.1 hypothetical protein [Clostridium tagluense]MBZ9626139.1 hypothetical protein [Clostridium sp. FP2]MCB2311899.1 hypothetical protein [Clostridium tagluense]MCB2317348.1 hypothetical protein [Clostridium tagluense]MCB2322861.1 hypothetical protein [Clostridium tagluense]
MLKKFSKKLLMGLVCSSLVIFTSVPAFASTKEATSVKALFTARSANGDTLVDEAPISVGVWSGIASFNVNVPDSDKRHFKVTSSIPVRVEISSADGSTRYDSGEPMLNPTVARNFCPNKDYRVMIFTKNEANANVTVGMSKRGENISAINIADSPVKETSELWGQATEMYYIGFQKPGTYRFTVLSEVINNKGYGLNLTGLNATLSPTGGHSEFNMESGTTFTSDIVISTPTPSIYQWNLMLYNNNNLGSHGPYTVTIEKLN